MPRGGRPDLWLVEARFNAGVILRSAIVAFGLTALFLLLLGALS